MVFHRPTMAVAVAVGTARIYHGRGHGNPGRNHVFSADTTATTATTAQVDQVTAHLL
jgi:hypothetical protein